LVGRLTTVSWSIDDEANDLPYTFEAGCGETVHGRLDGVGADVVLDREAT
jgi:hypothetical protein